MANFFSNLFNNKKQADNPATPDSPESTTAPATTPDTPPTNTTTANLSDFTTTFFSFRERGFTNGSLGVDPEPFSKYAVSFNAYQYLDEKLERLKNKIVRLKGQLTTAINERKAFLETLQPLQQEIGELDTKIKYEEDNIARRKKAIDDRKEYIKQFIVDKSWLYIIILLVAAVAFIGAEFGVSISVVADALNLGKDHFETWVLAAGICVLSILIKPGYDRLVEEKYINGQPRRFVITILIVIGLTFLFLTISGVFRYSAFKYQQESSDIRAYNDKIQKESLNTTTNLPLNSPKPPKELPSYVNFLANNSTIVTVFFILSGVLFAIGGAICLGIVIPILRMKSILLIYNKKNKKDEKANEKAAEAIAKWIEQRFKPQTQKELAEKKHILSDDIVTLRQQLVEAEIELDAVIKDLFLAKITRNRHEYEDGYARGLRIAELGGEAWVDDNFRQMYGDSAVYDEEGNPVRALNKGGNTNADGTAAEDNGEGTKSSTTTGGIYSRTRPFVALRKIILNKYRDSVSGKNTYSAHPIDFNIDSNS